MARKKYTTSLVLILSFLASSILIIIGVWYPEGSFESLAHVPNLAAAVYAALVVSFGAAYVLGSPDQKSFPKKGLLTLAAVGVVAWVTFAVWFSTGFN